MKVCNKCNINKELSEFYKDKYKKDGYKTICINCQKNYYLDTKETKKISTRKYYEKNKEIISIRKKDYRDRNLEHFKEYSKEYYEKNKEQIKSDSLLYKNKNRKMINEKFNEKMKNDPLFKFIFNLRNNIRNSIKRVGYKKNSRSYEILGIDYENFIKYIQEQFVDGMSWENHGEWHLDHRIPISLAKCKDDALKLCHYTNYQPLWAKDNLSKGNKY